MINEGALCAHCDSKIVSIFDEIIATKRFTDDDDDDDDDSAPDSLPTTYMVQ